MASLRSIFDAMTAISGDEWIRLTTISGPTGLVARLVVEIDGGGGSRAACFSVASEEGDNSIALAILRNPGGSLFYMAGFAHFTMIAGIQPDGHELQFGCDTRRVYSTRLEAVKELCRLGVEAEQAAGAISVLENLMQMPDDEENTADAAKAGATERDAEDMEYEDADEDMEYEDEDMEYEGEDEASPEGNAAAEAERDSVEEEEWKRVWRGDAQNETPDGVCGKAKSGSDAPDAEAWGMGGWEDGWEDDWGA